MANILDAKKNMDSFNVVLLDPQRLLPTEEFIEERVIQIEQDIIREGRWLKPILVERTSLIIMDGHHRREFARRHSLRRVPCLLLDYSQVELSSWRDEFDLHPEEVIARGLQRRLYPAKTTRHVVHAAADILCHYPLSELELKNVTYQGVE
ncbi:MULTISPECIES: ParB N-terminal domain-containing protein [Serratia]|uniref:ParB N-terminal domain-containing protein n=1 Tax=Serratia TaxID=613 RepID=UPI0006578BE6|nr:MULTISPECIES: ParB N-terminal domain-containing protein [Serratia]AVU36172.1 hypothetical protein AM681_16785 [Serratia marcescens]AVU41273.1 hypothetical protein AS658_16625 [Serratia marcescens]EGT0503039.1 ParB N-terminal domain-containing protein [Serratia marcescens]EHT9830696.1 ParB N-terminal domain-containing protein [Serratia marcescens]EIJ7463290.1 ParB N-terminal domain-containing protein [Serratia marcescens]